MIKKTAAALPLAGVFKMDYSLKSYRGEEVSLRIAEDQNGVLHLIDENTMRPIAKQLGLKINLVDPVNELQTATIEIITDKRYK